MPLVRFKLKNEFASGKPELYNDVINREEPKAVLDAVSVSGLVGILRQLGDLSEFAAEVFHGLQEQVVTTASRSHKLMVRVQNLEAKLPPIEKAVLAQTSHIHFAYTAGCEWRSRFQNEHHHFINDDLPQFVMDSYEECRHPPNLHLLDKFDANGPGSCLKRYSDPSYYKRILGSLDGTSSEILQDRKSRKIKKKRLSRKNRGMSRATSLINLSGSMQFTTRVNDQTQHTSVLDKALKSNPGRRSYSFDLRSQSGHSGHVLHQSSSLRPEDQEYRESSSSRSTNQHDDVNSISSNQETGRVDDYSSHGTLPDPSAISSSAVTWEEKTEIVEPLLYDISEDTEILCAEPVIHTKENVDNDLPWADQTEIVPDDVQKRNSSEIQSTNPELYVQKKAAIPQNVDHIDIPNDDVHTLATVSGKYQDEEAESDTEDFMDALNTIESESENELDLLSIAKVSRYSSDFHDKVTEESTQEHVLQCPDHEPSTLEQNVGSHVQEDTVTHEKGEHSKDDHPCNMKSNYGSHILLDRDSPEYLYTDKDVGHSLEHQPSDLRSNAGSHILVDKDDHPCNMKSNYGSHILLDRDSPEYLYTDEDVGHSLEHEPSDLHSNAGSHILVDKDDHKHVVHRTDHHASDMEISGGSHISDKDAHEPLYAPELVECSPKYQPSNVESNSGLHNVVHKDACENMEDSPEHFLSSMGLDIKSYASTEKDAHSVEHHPDYVEPDAVPHSCSDRDFLSDISNLVPTSYSLPQAVPSHELPNSTVSSSDLSFMVPSSGDFPNTAHFSYDSPNSASSSHDSPNSVSSSRDSAYSVSSQSCSKEYIRYLDENSSVKSTDIKSRESASIHDEPGGNVMSPLNSQLRTINLPESSSNKTTSRICESLETVSNLKSCQSVTFWTNGGLLGLQPSKPPDFAVTSSANQDSLDNSKEENYGTSNENNMSTLNGHIDSLATSSENAETFRSGQSFTSNEVCSVNQSNGLNFKKDLCSDTKADSSSALSKSDQICCNSYANAQINGSLATSIWTVGTEPTLAPGMSALSTDASQERERKLSQSFGLGQRLLFSGFRRKFLPVHNDTSELLRIVQDIMPEQGGRHQKFKYHTTADRISGEPFKCEFTQGSPNSSPPIEYMKISFCPVNTSDKSRLKLKIMDGSNCHETGNTFSSFQLVPEHAAPLHDIGSDSDDDTFCPSSPHISDEDDHSSHLSDSNSEQWESSENRKNKEQDLCDSLCRISPEESTSGSSELREVVSNRNHLDGGITNQCRGNDMEHAFSSPLLDLPDFNSMCHITKHTIKDGSDAESPLESQLPKEAAPMPPPLPPAPRQFAPSDTDNNGQHSVSESYSGYALAIGDSSICSQSEMNTPERKVNGEASLYGSKIKEQKLNGRIRADTAANDKGMNEREDFLHQIRTKSFTLRPTVAAKATVTTAGSTNVSVTAILEKANAIRQAVGSDDGEDYDTWSDT